MNIFLADKGERMIPTDTVISWVLRTDLAPVPRTLEFTLQNKNGIDKELVVGAYVWTGGENLKFEILKVSKSASTGPIQGDSALQSFTVYAVLESCRHICFRLDKPVISRNTTIGGMYRACGAKVTIENDIAIDSFAALKGDVPSIAIARELQEAGACLVYRNKKLSALRLTDMMKQKPVDVIGQSDSADKIESEFLERHEIPSFYTVKPDGSMDYGNFDKARQVRYVPRKSPEVLNNMTRVMVTRRVIESDMVQSINAGDVVRVAERNYGVITAAHWGMASDGVRMTGTKLWVGELV